MIITCVSKKGGVGKTTTTVNLAAGLAIAGARVLLVDLDSQASASRSLGIAREGLSPSVADALFRGRSAREVVRPSGRPGLELLTGSVDLRGADQELAGYATREERLARVLEPLRDTHDFILVDCPPSLSLLSVNALVASDLFLVPVVPHFLAVDGLENVLGSIDRLRFRSGARTRPLGILLTVVDLRSRAARVNRDKIRELFGDLVLRTEIRVNIRLAEAPAEGKTIFEHAPEAPGAMAHRLLTEEVLERVRNMGFPRSTPLSPSRDPGPTPGDAPEGVSPTQDPQEPAPPER